ncbi:pro-neuregulin-1, membrane-bound isoform isoform X3 [Sphaeramia orbicularis]|uniref:pro-neuregulin-1, membrane-bound isoform isoform X3 n=1 Tax=Sphaeramia orbicularis TaxID=375764 RepID=UPI00117CA05F|nr:pro-neuregulin-1, membrane-bound isoform-like isoform X3 [Sphaeramia orbicularis]
MTEGMEDISAGPAPPPGSPAGSTVDTGQVPEEKPEETEAAGESREEGEEEGTAEEGGGGGGSGDDGERSGALGIVALPGTCCVCVEMEQINNCLHSEKICILPILACLLSLALCTAGLKWVFVDKIFEYEPPTHLDPKRIGQDPIIISVDPTLGLTMSLPHSSSPSTISMTTAITVTPGRPEVLVEEKSTRGPFVPPKVTQSDSSVTMKYNAVKPTNPKQTTQEFNNNIIPTISATSTTTTLKTSSHVTRCSDSQKNYCVNGGECFTLEIMPGSTKFLCRCPNEFTGDRCQNYVMASFYKHLGIEFMEAEELYQKRILTIAGICIALLVVGIMCVVAYCKTKKQRKKLHDRLKQSLRRKRNSKASSSRGRPSANMPLQDLQLVNQCNGITMEHAADKDTETTFSTSKYALSAHEATALTNISSQRFVPDVTSPATPGSPPSEMSAPLSSLAISVPSVALSPSGEEERPLLLSRQPHKSSSARDDQKRTSAHYNHGHVAHSAPSSPSLAKEHGGGYRTPGDRDAHALAQTLAHTNNNITDYGTKRVANGHVLYNVESGGDVTLESEGEEPQGEHTPFLIRDSTPALLLRAVDGSRTNPASANHDLMVQASGATATKQDPAAV